jgi:hypothetical protein
LALACSKRHAPQRGIGHFEHDGAHDGVLHLLRSIRVGRRGGDLVDRPLHQWADEVVEQRGLHLTPLR